MAVTADKNKMVNFRVEPSLAEEAKAVIEEQGYTMTRAFQLFLKNVVATKKLGLLTEEELEKERLFLELQQEIKENQAAIEAGQGVSIESLRSKYGV